MIPFNKPCSIGNELVYIEKAIKNRKVSGDGEFTKKCSTYFEEKYGFLKVLLTTSCTDALEMAALLLDVKYGDEVIMPSYTFVSTANAFVLRGATIKFCDSNPLNPNIDVDQIEALITPRTKAIVVVHYAGVACDMERIVDIGEKYNIEIVEDAAQAIDSFYKGKALGSYGALATFSFHETKNIVCGEGGMLVINKPDLINRAEHIREKGTNRSAFYRGEVNKYGWVDIGSSFLPSELLAAYLYAQLEKLDVIQKRRCQLWSRYFKGLQVLAYNRYIEIPNVPEYATVNGHIFYILTEDEQQRDKLIKFLRKNDIMTVFHYLPLHESEFYKESYHGDFLKNCNKYNERLLRLPLFYEMTDNEVDEVIKQIRIFYSR